MKEVRNPLKKSILKGIGLFLAALCAFLVAVQYFFLRNTLYGQYQSRLTDILNEAENVIDTADLAECIRTGVKSEKYEITQNKLNEIKNRTGVHYLYVVIPLNAGATDNMQNVIAAVADYEKDDPEAYVTLNEVTGDDYTQVAAKKYFDAYNGSGTSFFSNTTQFGNDYTGMVVLRHPDTGEKVAALCADFEAGVIQGQIRENLLDILIVVVVIGMVFATVFMIWADRHLVQPIRKVEEDVTKLARKSHTTRKPDAMVYSAEGIRTGNEVESLAKAVEQMSLDMRDYVKNLVQQEKELVRLSSMANRDMLTHVGNRNAYDQYAEDLQLKMTEGHIEFGILLADMNGLGRINEKYGNDRGDLYLQKGCRVICEVFRHSPVFRMSGDKFTVMLLGEDFINRQALTEEAQSIYFKSASDEKTPPWEQVSVSFGQAEYAEGQDRTVRDVYDRAEEALRVMKESRNGNAGA